MSITGALIALGVAIVSILLMYRREGGRPDWIAVSVFATIIFALVYTAWLDWPRWVFVGSLLVAVGALAWLSRRGPG